MNVLERFRVSVNNWLLIHFPICYLPRGLLNMKLTSQDKENNVVLYLKNGLSYREIAKKLDTGCSTIHNISKRNGIERPRSKEGWPSKLPEVAKRNIVRNITFGKCGTAFQVKKMLRQDSSINVSTQTVRNIRKTKGLQAKHSVKKLSISVRN